MEADSSRTLNRWAEHLKGLLNRMNPFDPNFAGRLTQMLEQPHLDDPPSFSEVEESIKLLKKDKATGPDGLPAEFFKYGGPSVSRRLHYIISLV